MTEYIPLQKKYYDGIMIKEVLDEFENDYDTLLGMLNRFASMDGADVVEVVRCKDCKYWRRATAYGFQLLFGHCESDEMWQSLYGETCEVEHIDTEEDHYCSYGERKDDG